MLDHKVSCARSQRDHKSMRYHVAGFTQRGGGGGAEISCSRGHTTGGG